MSFTPPFLTPEITPKIRTAVARELHRAEMQPNGCLLWRGQLTGNGYPVLHVWEDGRRRVYMATRLLYRVIVGPLSAAHVIRHTCDIPQCVQPNHLVAGTQAQNMADKEMRGRGNHHHKLSATFVRAARRRRANGERYVDIARGKGVHWTTIQAAVLGRTWRDVA